jgi:hypothetical protein
VVPSALRTLSVVTLLSAVSGTVFLLNDHSPHPGGQSLISSSGVRFASAALVLPADRQAPVAVSSSSEDVTYRVQLHQSALERFRAQRVAVTKAAQLKATKAKAAKVAKHEAAELKLARAKAATAARERAVAARKRRVHASAEVSRSSSRDPQAVAKLMLAQRGWGSSQFSCLVSLWNRESGWNIHAANPSSGAYGIPQALPGRKMASAGPDWENNAATQIAWGLSYISSRYGTPCGAWGHSQATGWY